ncbi:hypothetical protein [Breoghania sp. JC706]|uniref:hypothetical protein n=1 Tax=Breoghania sp. JC706 TaxID=3117732 RepID=UPI00300A46D8
MDLSNRASGLKAAEYCALLVKEWLTEGSRPAGECRLSAPPWPERLVGIGTPS